MMNANPNRIDPLVERLIERLQSDDPLKRLNAASALRLNGRRATAALPALERLLGDEDRRVRLEAKNAIERIRQNAA